MITRIPVSIYKNPSVSPGFVIRSGMTLVVFILCLLPVSIPAQQPSINTTKVTGLLNSRKIAVGERGVYVIQVDNGTLDAPPKFIKAPSLTIAYQGRNTNLSIKQDSKTGQTIRTNQTPYFYTISCETEGTFTIPSITVNIRNKSYSTKAAELIVFKRKEGVA